jgi:creatinine amidohydrolase
MAMERDDPARLAFYEGRARGLPARTKATARGTTQPNPIAAAGAWWPSVYLGDDAGYTGDPAAATVQTGEAMAEAIVARLSAFFAAFAAAVLPSGGMAPARRGPG